MEGQKKRRPPVLLLMILVLFLTVGGLALAVQSFGRYDTLLLEQSDSQLYGLARSVDRSVSGALEQFIGELDYLIRLENFTDAEADCLFSWPMLSCLSLPDCSSTVSVKSRYYSVDF